MGVFISGILVWYYIKMECLSNQILFEQFPVPAG